VTVLASVAATPPALGARFVAPACVQVPPGWAGTYGDDVAEVATALGRPPEPEQKLALDVLTAHDGRGRFLSVEAGVEGPRQATGKTSAIMLPILIWTALTDPDLITWTSHQTSTHLASFRELVGRGPKTGDGLIDSCDWLSRRIRARSFDHSTEGVTFTNGAELIFQCRSAKRGRGRSGGTIFADEALFLSAPSMGALLPTLTTRSLHGTPRAYYASSAPKTTSAVLWSLRRRALAADPTLTYVGWWADGGWDDPGCADPECGHGLGVAGCALDDPQAAGTCNILLGRRVSEAFLATERATFADEPREYGREVLGWGEAPVEDVTDLSAWRRCTDPGSKPEPFPVGIGVAVAPGGRSAAVVAAGYATSAAGRVVHVELLESHPGTAWLPGYLAGRQGQKWGGAAVTHRAGTAQRPTPEATETAAWAAAGVHLRAVSTGAFTVACDRWDRLVASGGLRHLGDPRLATSLAAARRKPAGDAGWVMTWRRGSQGGADAAAAMAMVLAVGALDTGTDQILF
jgi:hypothetical protein